MQTSQKIVKARATLLSKVPYLDYNYGRYHQLTRAAVAGDLSGFLSAAQHVTQNMDITVADLADLVAAAIANGGAA